MFSAYTLPKQGQIQDYGMDLVSVKCQNQMRFFYGGKKIQTKDPNLKGIPVAFNEADTVHVFVAQTSLSEKLTDRFLIRCTFM